MQVEALLGAIVQRDGREHDGPIVSRGHLLFANGREYFEIGGLMLSAADDAPLDQFGYRWPSQIVSFVAEVGPSLVEEPQV